MADHKITLTYLNVRQSIAILLIKLVVTDILFAVIIIGFYFILVQLDIFSQFAITSAFIFLTAFAIVGIIKILTSIYIILLWLYEYYEITPDHIIHKRGIFARKTEMYRLDKLRIMEIHDSFLGELFNFATITFYDLRLQKYLDLYLIHNPKRYSHILRTLRPRLELKSDHIQLPFLPRDEDEIEDEKKE